MGWNAYLLAYTSELTIRTSILLHVPHEIHQGKSSESNGLENSILFNDSPVHALSLQSEPLVGIYLVTHYNI